MTQQILSIDSQILNSIQLCARRTEYQFNRNLNPLEKAEALESGDLLHKMLEVYYILSADLPKRDTEFWEEVEALINNNDSPVSNATRAGHYYATKMSLPLNEVEETIYQFAEYCKFYEYDAWRPLAVEEVGSKLLYEDSSLKIIYNFKIDMVAEHGSLIAPWDHKHSKRRQDPNGLSNQFIGYAWGLGTTHVIVNKIGFQKTLSPKERFQRDTLFFSSSRIQEWVDNTVWWCKMLNYHIQENHWPLNLTSCDKYSGCIYRSICRWRAMGCSQNLGGQVKCQR